MSKALYLSNERYVAALRRQRDRIANGVKFEAVNCDVSGDKFTHASWGLCSHDKEAWPDREDHLFDRFSPKYRKQHQPCPLQSKGSGNGCIHGCLIFKHRQIGPKQRQKAVELYEERIGKMLPKEGRS